MSIAYLIPSYPMPSQTFIRREIAGLEARGLTIHRFAMRRFSGETADLADAMEQSRTHYILDCGARGLLGTLAMEAISRPRQLLSALRAAVSMGRRSEKGLVWHLAYLAEACYLRRRLSECDVRHIHAHFGTNAAAVAMLCRLLGGPPYSVTVHGPEEFDAPRPLALGEKIRHAAFVVAISQFTRSQLFRWSDQPHWAKIHVVHCGLDEALLNRDLSPVPDRPRLVHVGRLSEQKGQLLLIEAAAKLHARGLDFELVIVGDGPLRGDLEQLIEKYGLRGRVWITGFLDNAGVRREMEAARALVMPSFAEGLPVVIMEALALGRPVISTYIAGIPELVEPGRIGWLIPAGSVDPLVEAMATVLSADPTDLQAMGRAGAAEVALRHDITTEAKKLATLIADPTATISQGMSHSQSTPALTTP